MTKAGGVHPLELDGIEISPAVALEALYTRVAVAVNQHRGTGALALPELDAASRALLGAASLPPLPEPVPDMQVDALYLATEIYPAGGHRILLEQLIRSRPQDRHKVVFTGLLNNTRAFGVARMEDYGVPVFNTDARDILWDKWMALRAHVAACAPERIFLLHHSEDILAASCGYGPQPWCGYSERDPSGDPASTSAGLEGAVSRAGSTLCSALLRSPTDTA